MPLGKDTADRDVEPAALSRRALREITAVMSDIRVTVKRLSNTNDSALAIMDADAVDAIKDLYYVISNEDPLNVQPARRLLLEQHVVQACLLPVLASVNSDPAVEENQKRWAVGLYHTFRALSAITSPIPESNELLKPGCALDSLLLDARVALVRTPGALNAVVALLQYYVERKAEKMARFAPAEESKIEDARIENILVFLRNILAEPRSLPAQKQNTKERDVPIHFALVAALHDADLYTTLTILFSSREEARGHLTRLVFVVGDIFRNTFRLSSSREIAAYSLSQRKPKVEVKPEKVEKVDPASETEAPAAPNTDDTVAEPAPKNSVFDSDNEDEDKMKDVTEVPNAEEKPRNRALERRNRRAANLREAMRRERAYVGGGRAVTACARWTNRFSGQFALVKNEPTETIKFTKNDDKQKQKHEAKPVLGGRSAVKKSRSTGEEGILLANFELNSDLLCVSTGAKMRRMVDARIAHGNREVRAELAKAGRRALADLLAEFIEENAFGVFTVELRARIMDLVTKRTAAESEELPAARKAFLSVVAVAVGFQRERIVLRRRLKSRFEVHKGDASDALKADSCPVGASWLPVERGIELETFKLVFDALIAFSGKGKHHAEDAMLATNALKQMMKMIQCMVAHPENEDDVQKEWEAIPESERPKRVRLTGRDFGLCTLEDLFEREDYLNAPCSLAREFDARWHTYDHLANVIEVAHAFTSTLKDEKELEKIKVLRKKRKRKKKPKKKTDEEGQKEENETKKDGEEGTKEDGATADGGEEEEKKSDEPVSAFDQTLKDIEKEKKAENANNEVEKPREVENTEGVDATLANANEPAEETDANPREDDSKNQAEEGATAADNPTSSSEKPVTETGNNSAAAEKNVDNVEKKSEDGQKVGASEAESTDSPGDTAKKPSGESEKKKELEDDDESEPEPDVEVEKKVESVGVIRRFAHSRALQVLALPIRACLCKASSLSGGLYAVPDSSRAIAVPLIAAKSAMVLETIWNTSGGRDKGALRGHFFTFSLLQLISLTMSIKKSDPQSVVGRLAEFGAELTRVLHTWLEINPGMALDVFLGLEKGMCMQYAHTLHLKNMMLNDDQDQDQDKNGSDNSDAEDALDEIERRANMAMLQDEDSEDERMAEMRRARRDERIAKAKLTPTPTSAKPRRRRQPVAVVEDDDVDDIDALNIGRNDDSDEEDPKPPPMPIDGNDDVLLKSTTPRAERRKKRKSRVAEELGDDEEDYSSDSGIDERPKPRKKRKKSIGKQTKKVSTGRGKKSKKPKEITESEVPQVFSSDDEFEDAVLSKFMGALSNAEELGSALKEANEEKSDDDLPVPAETTRTEDETPAGTKQKSISTAENSATKSSALKAGIEAMDSSSVTEKNRERHTPLKTKAKSVDPDSSAMKAAALAADIYDWAAVDAEPVTDGMASQSSAAGRVARRIVLPSDDESD